MKNKAFTLIELLVVVAIIGILAAVGVTTFGGFQDKAKIAAAKACLLYTSPSPRDKRQSRMPSSA